MAYRHYVQKQIKQRKRAMEGGQSRVETENEIGPAERAANYDDN
jgi:hypothetical protein